MELIEIIKSSLSLFSIASFILIIVCYVIYKIKDRSRIKPYDRVNIQNPVTNHLIEDRVQQEMRSRQVNQIRINQVPVSQPQKPYVVLSQPQRQEPVQLQRVMVQPQIVKVQPQLAMAQANGLLLPEYQGNQTLRVPMQNRFKLVNDSENFYQYSHPGAFMEKPKQKIVLNKEKNNIYDLYASSNEKMHKLKLAAY